MAENLFISIGALILAFIAIILSYKSFDNSKKGRIFDENEIQRGRIIEEIQMYLFIAYGDKWGWFPKGPGVNDKRYFEYSEFENRFFSYLGQVEPKIQDDYLWVVEKTISGVKAEEESEVKERFEKIKGFAKENVNELRKQLN